MDESIGRRKNVTEMFWSGTIKLEKGLDGFKDVGENIDQEKIKLSFLKLGHISATFSLIPYR